MFVCCGNFVWGDDCVGVCVFIFWDYFEFGVVLYGDGD